MTKSVFNQSSLLGLTSVVGPYEKYIDDEVELYGGDKKQIERIKKTIGLNKRHVVGEKITGLDLGYLAATNLINGMSIDINSIDAFINVTQTPDFFQPSNSNVLHGMLNLGNDCSSLDVNIGCSGYVYGLWLAQMMVDSGSCSNVLLITSDTMSRCVNRRDRSTAPLFGDAASASLVGVSPSSSKSYFSLHTQGSGSKYIKIPAGGYRMPLANNSFEEVQDHDGNWRSELDLYMDGHEVFNFTKKKIPEDIENILDYSGFSKEEIDFFIFHQANKYILSTIAKKAKLPLEKVPLQTVYDYGNQSSSSIPCTINGYLQNSLKGSKRLLLSGFGVGLSWASCIIETQDIYSPEVVIYHESDE
jgi:3-oxoacyl-[acyl-carrier-protein] synthase III